MKGINAQGEWVDGMNGISFHLKPVQYKIINQLTKDKEDLLKKVDRLQKELAAAKENNSEISRPSILESPNVPNLENLVESYLDDLEEKGYSKDIEHYCYTELLTSFYGEDVFEYINYLSESYE